MTMAIESRASAPAVPLASEGLAGDGLGAGDAVDAEGEGAVVGIAEGDRGLPHDALVDGRGVEARGIGGRPVGDVDRAGEHVGGTPASPGNHVPDARTGRVVGVPDAEDVARGMLDEVP